MPSSIAQTLAEALGERLSEVEFADLVDGALDDLVRRFAEVSAA